MITTTERACVGSVPIGTVVSFQDVRDELVSDTKGVVTGEVVSRGRGLTSIVRCLKTSKKYTLQNHHAVNLVKSASGGAL